MGIDHPTVKPLDNQMTRIGRIIIDADLPDEDVYSIVNAIQGCTPFNAERGTTMRIDIHDDRER